MIRQKLLFVLAAFVLFSIPVASYAQGKYRDRNRDRDWRNSRNYDRNYVIDSAKRVDKLSGQLKGDLGDALNRSRLNGSDREDRVNEMMSEFHSIAAQFKDRIDNGRDLSYAANEARRLLSLGWRLDEIISRNHFGSKVESKWSQISRDLRVIQDAYDGYSYR